MDRRSRVPSPRLRREGQGEGLASARLLCKQPVRDGRDEMKGWQQAMTPEAIIRRLSGLKPGRRGFGGTSDAIEAASFRRELQDDRELNPGLISPPSAALRPAAVLVPLI